MLIFDRFPDHKHADAFAIAVRDTFRRSTQVFDSQKKSNAVDPFPFELQPPIVLVERDSPDGEQLERQIEKYVLEFNSVFAGT